MAGHLEGATQVAVARKPMVKVEDVAKVRRWWLRAVTALTFSQLVASQTLLCVPGWSILSFLLALALACLLAWGAYEKHWELRLGKWVGLPAAFVAYCLLRAFSGVEGAEPWNVVAQLVSSFIGGISVAGALEVGVRFRVLGYAILTNGLVQFLLWQSGWAPDISVPSDATRFFGTTGNANELAAQLTMGACLIWLMPRRSGLWPCLGAFGLVVFAVGVTGSREGLLITAFFLILVLFQGFSMVPKKRRRLFLALVVAVPCGLGLVAVPLVANQALEILSVRRAMAGEDSSSQTRAEMVSEGFQLWKNAPVFGNGLDSFRGMSGQDTYSHNTYVELLCDTGFLGAALYYSMYVLVGVRTRRLPRSLWYATWLFVAMLLAADIAQVSYQRKQSVMILMVLLMATRSSRYAMPARNSREKKHPAPKGRLAERLAGAKKRLTMRPRRFITGS